MFFGIRRSGSIVLEQHRHGAIPCDLGDKWSLMLGEKSCDGRKRLDEYLRHLLALEIAGGQDEGCDTGIYQRQAFNIPVSDPVGFGENNPSLWSDL